MFERFIPSPIAFAIVALPIAIAAPDAQALTFIDDRPGFTASFTSNITSSIVDSNGAFATDPTAATALASVTRAGSVGGQALSYSIYDVGFSNSPDGTIAPGSVGGDISRLSNLDIESPASQDDASGTSSWGIDSSGSNGSLRNAALFHFNRPIGHFGLDLHDFESSAAGALGQLRVYRNGSLLPGLSQTINWSDDGNAVSHFLGFVATDPSEFFDAIAFVLGDDDAEGNGYSERWAADGFTFGEAYAVPSSAAATTAVPTPALLPGLIGLAASLVRKKRQAK